MSNNPAIGVPDGDHPAVLTVRNLAVLYRDLQVLWNVSMEVPRGACVAVLGANSAGKTSLLRAIAGLVPARSGSLTFAGQEIVGMPAHLRAARGLVLVPDERAIFASMSVMENLKLGAYSLRDRRQVEDGLALVFSIFPVPARRKGQTAGSLSGGEQKMLALGKALVARPSLIMLDEPSSGLAPIMVDAVYDALAQIRKSMHLAILLVEQNIYSALDLATHCYVLQNGRIVFGGPSSEIPDLELFRKAYLGI